MVIAVDWDGTLVDAQTQEWLPGAERALQTLVARYRTVIIHTCRANWPEGLASIEVKLGEALLSNPRRLRIHSGPGKPAADAYIDNLAIRFDGDWPETLDLLPLEQAVERPSRRGFRNTTPQRKRPSTFETLR